MGKSMLEILKRCYENHSQKYDSATEKGLDNVKICIGYYREIDEEVMESYYFPKGTFNLLSIVGDGDYYNWHYIPKGYYKGKDYIPYE